MQTFLPYPNFKDSVAVLDRQRLGKQRVENLQIIKALTLGGGLHGGWARHPASRMWLGYVPALMAYQKATCDEWATVRGYKDTCYVKSLAMLTEEQRTAYETDEYELPDWFGSEEFHKAHKSNLLRKDYEYYKFHFLGVPDDIPYIWPGPSLETAKVDAVLV
jgi:hypothetical protein